MPIAEVQLPDGRIAQFEVDEGTSPDEVVAFAEQNLDKLSAPEPEPEAKSLPAMAGDYLKKSFGQVMGDGRPFAEQMAEVPQISTDDPRFRDTTRKAMDTGLATLIPGSMLGTAARRLGFGTAVGASHGDTLDDKISGGIQGAMFSGMAETAPAIQTMGTMAKRALVDPTWNKEAVVGATLRRLAEDPTNPRVLDATIAALKNPQQFVRGSEPTTPQASGNAGLWGLYKATMAREPAADRAIQDAQNLARLKAFKELGVGENAGRQADDLQAAALGRLDDAAAEAEAGGINVDLSGLEGRIDELLNGPVAVDRVIRTKLEQLRDSLRTPDGRMRLGFADAHSVKSRGINRAVYGNNGLKIEGPSGEELEGVMGGLGGMVDDAINAVIPGSPAYDEFRRQFATGKTVERRNQVLSDLLSKGSSPGVLPVIDEVAPGQFGPTGDMREAEILSTKLLNAVKSKQFANNREVLTDKQLERIGNIKKDLARNIPRDVKRGSDTYQNLAIDYLASDLLGAPGAGNTLFGGVTKGAANALGSALTQIPGIKALSNAIPSANALENPELRMLMVEALKNPELAAKLMEAYKPASLLYTTIPGRVGPSLWEQTQGQQ